MQRFFLFKMMLFALFLSFVLPLNAAELAETGEKALTLNEALEMGLENSLDLKKNRIDLSSAEYSANRLWAEVFPSINASLGASYGGPVLSENEADAWKGTLSAGLGVTLGLNAGLPYTMKNIRLAYQVRLLSYEDARNQLEIKITKEFFRLIANRDYLTLLTDMLQLAQLQHERNQIAFNNGLVGERSLMQSRLGFENARYNLSAAHSDYANQMSEFLSLLGIDLAGAEPVLEGKIEIAKIEADAQMLIVQYLSQRPDIVSRRQEIERLENAEKLAFLSGRVPSLRLEMNWNDRKQGDNPFTDSLTGSATVNIPIDPWVPGTKPSQTIRNAKFAVDKARMDLQSTQEAAASQIRSLTAALRNSWDSIEIARLSLGVAERGYELTEQGFRNGTIESLALEDARNNLANARQRLLQSELSYLNMFLDLSAALNKNWKDLMRDYVPQENES